MSFLDSIVNVGKSALGFFSGSSVASTLARTAALGFVLNKVNSSVNKKNEPPDRGQRITLDPKTDNTIPVVYGTAYVNGLITDAEITNNNQTMWYCVTLCEKTGVKLSDNQPSSFSFLDVYWNTYKLNFKSDGVTVASGVDENGNVNNDLDGLIRFYPFNGSSANPVRFTNQTQGNTALAYQLFPNWSTSHTMSDLIFCLVRVEYNKEKKVTGVNEIKFKIRNSMTMPGDVLNDYMTNTRYGAGIPVEEIYQR